MPVKPIGQSMVEANLINPQQLEELLEYQAKASERVPLGRLSVDLGLVKEEEFVPFLASYFQVPYINLQHHAIVQKKAIDAVPESIAKRFGVLPIVKEEDTLTVAMSDPLDLTTLENLETVTQCRIRRVLSTSTQIKQGITAYYSGVFLQPKEEVKETLPLASLEKYKNGWPLASSLVRLLIERALKSDINLIHIQPEKNRMKILFRSAGKLEKVASYPKAVLASVVDFIKKAARLNTDKNNIPQSGYFVFNLDESNIEVGVSVFPTVSGERIVLEVPRRIGWLDEEAWFKVA